MSTLQDRAARIISSNYKEINSQIDIDTFESSIEKSFKSGVLSETEREKAYEQLNDLICKARVTKYFKREGTPGKYKYYYTEAEYREAKGGGEKSVTDNKKGDKVSYEGKDYIIDSIDASSKTAYLRDLDGKAAEDSKGSMLQVHTSRLKKVESKESSEKINSKSDPENLGHGKQAAIDYGVKLVDSGERTMNIRAKILENFPSQKENMSDIIDTVLNYSQGHIDLHDTKIKSGAKDSGHKVKADPKDVDGAISKFNEVLNKLGGGSFEDNDNLFISKKPIAGEMLAKLENITGETESLLEKHGITKISTSDISVKDLASHYEDVFSDLGYSLTNEPRNSAGEHLFSINADQ